VSQVGHWVTCVMGHWVTCVMGQGDSGFVGYGSRRSWLIIWSWVMGQAGHRGQMSHGSRESSVSWVTGSRVSWVRVTVDLLVMGHAGHG